MASITKQTFAIGQEIKIPGGNFISYLDGTDALEIHLIKNNATVAKFDSALPSFQSDMREHEGRGFAFDHVKIISATAQTCEIGVSQHPISYNRSSGSVTISGTATVSVSNMVSELEAAQALTELGGDFIAGVNRSASASKYSYVQLLNPAASGVDVYVDSVYFGTQGGSSSVFRRYGTAVATLETTGASNAKDGVAVPVAELRTDARSSHVGTEIAALRNKADNIMSWRFTTPVKLSPGEGLAVSTTAVNEALRANFEWREVAV